MLRKVLLGSVALAAFSQLSIGAVMSGPVVSPVNGHTYYLLQADTWTNSESQAITLGGHLATIRDQAENDWI